MLGTQEEAETILRYVRTCGVLDAEIFDLWIEEHGGLPEGWTWIATGGWRYVFIAPSGLVYKIDHYDCSDYSHTCNQFTFTNAGEFEAYKTITASGAKHEGWQIAEMSAWIAGDDETVICMERVRGRHLLDEDAEEESALAAQAALGVLDLQVLNYLVDASGVRVIIDLASRD